MKFGERFGITSRRPYEQAMLGQNYLYRDYNFNPSTLGVGATPPSMTQLAATGIFLSSFGGGATTEQVFGAVELDHDWAEGTLIYPHVHWMPVNANAGNVKWQMTYTFLVDGAVYVAPATIPVVAAAPGVAWEDNQADFPAIVTAGYLIGTQFCFRFFRDPTDGDDTYGSDAMVSTIGLHVQVNSLGSRQLGVK